MHLVIRDLLDRLPAVLGSQDVVALQLQIDLDRVEYGDVVVANKDGIHIFFHLKKIRSPRNNCIIQPVNYKTRR